ncbi:MAG TPA: VOC family protein [Gemmatimonadales bacterium]|nr:VOC family protein [Gemmatimonadales bacterium]
MAHSVSTFLMFTGQAEAAMQFYQSLFPGATIRGLQRWAAGEAGPAGQVKQAELELQGHRLRCFDSPPVHDFTFTPAVSLFVECESEAELDAVFARLADGGQVLMPLGAYGFSRKFGWTNDRFGVSWQLNLA